MKKLMIAAAIVCTVAMSQAASLIWSMTPISATPAEGAKVADLNGAVAYWMDASTYDTFSGLAADKVAAYCAENKLYSANVAVNRGTAGFSSTNGSWTYDESKPQTVSGYIVLFDTSDAADANYYANTSVLSKDVPSAGNMTVATSFTGNTAGWQATAVPEPTSGLLLLLGMAGLALRRRCA